MFISSFDKIDWQTNDEHAPLKWKLLVDADISNSEGLSCGILHLPKNSVLSLHCHAPQEIYLIRKGKAILLSSDGEKELREDAVVYINKNEKHGLKNAGSTPLELIWIFPTDSWHDVKYNFVA